MDRHAQRVLTATRKEQMEPPYSISVCPNMVYSQKKHQDRASSRSEEIIQSFALSVLWTVKTGINHVFQRMATLLISAPEVPYMGGILRFPLLSIRDSCTNLSPCLVLLSSGHFIETMRTDFSFSHCTFIHPTISQKLVAKEIKIIPSKEEGRKERETRHEEEKRLLKWLSTFKCVCLQKKKITYI